MQTRLKVTRRINKCTQKHYIGVTKKYENKEDIGERYAMNLNVDIKLTDEQIKQIEEQTRIEVDSCILNGALDTYIKEVVKSCAKQIINEEIQSKGYRKLISERVTDILVGKGIIDEQL